MKGLALLLGAPKKKGDEPSEAEESGEYGKLTDEYASDAFDALKADDKEAFSEALKNLVDACMMDRE